MGFRTKVSFFIRHYGFGTAGAVTAIGFLIHEKLKDSKVAYATPVYAYTHQPSVKWDYNWDRQEPEHLVKPPKKNASQDESRLENEVKSKTSTVERHLLLVRHGHYSKEPKDDTCIGGALTILGQEQADITGKRLKELKLRYTKLLSSTMTRAKETGDIIHKHLSHMTMERDELLREGDPIPPEPPSANWIPEVSYHQEGARIEAAFRKHFHRADADQNENSYEVIVCHANVIRYFVCRALQFPPEGWRRMSVAHGSITHVVIHPGGEVQIRSLGESGHLPPEKITYHRNMRKRN